MTRYIIAPLFGFGLVLMLVPLFPGEYHGNMILFGVGLALEMATALLLVVDCMEDDNY